MITHAKIKGALDHSRKVKMVEINFISIWGIYDENSILFSNKLEVLKA